MTRGTSRTTFSGCLNRYPPRRSRGQKGSVMKKYYVTDWATDKIIEKFDTEKLREEWMHKNTYHLPFDGWYLNRDNSRVGYEEW